MVRICYRGIVPQAMLDNSLSCRWGALPLRLKDFARRHDRQQRSLPSISKIANLSNGGSRFC